MPRGRTVEYALILIAFVAYFVVFIPPNLTGSQDPNMLAAFQIDEWLQYSHVMRMTTIGESLPEIIRNIFVYQHYFYGYPFYLTSALAILPLRALAGFVPLEATYADTAAIMLVLRQLSPLFMIAAVALLVYCWTAFKHLGRSLLLLVFLLSVPAVFDNNMWWHAESLSVLLVVVTIFALYRDNLRFGRWFVVAALACGLSAGTKQVGFWFVLTVAVYVVWGSRGQGWRTLIKRGLLFAGIVVLTIVLVNPLLVIPTYARQIIDTQLLQARRIGFGWDVGMERGPLPWYQQTLRRTYGYWWIYLLAFGSCVWAAVADNQRRLLAVITLTYVVPFSIYLLFFVAAKPARYFLPVMLPLYAALGFDLLYCWDWRKPARLAVSLLVLGAMVFQIGTFLVRDKATYSAVLERERFSPALSFNAQLEQLFLGQIPAGNSVVIYRDPFVYVAPQPEREITMSWNLPSFELMAELNPDLILLQQQNIANFANPDFVSGNFRPDQARLNAAFYAAAAADAIPGYKQLLATDFGLALVRTKPDTD